MTIAATFSKPISIHFDDGDDLSRYKLVELPDDATLELIKAGHEISIRGQADDETIMIIGERTLKMRELCTSNTFLLAHTSGLVAASTSSILEIIYTKGETERLKKLLLECPYEGPNQIEPEKLEFLKADILPGVIQASDVELKKALKDNGAFLINGYYRILGSGLICRFFELFFTTSLLEDWQYSSLPISKSAVKSKFMEEFYDEFDAEILDNLMTAFQCPRFYTEDPDQWKISEEKICRFFVDQLLKARSNWLSSELLKAWKKLVGEFTPDLSMLRGLALVEEHPSEAKNELRIKQFSAEDLPSDPKDRFKILFQTKPRWYYDDLLPFIEGVAESDSKLQALLLKHGRRSTEQSSGRIVITPLLPP